MNGNGIPKGQARSAQVLAWLVDALRSGQFDEESQLPTERVLAETLEVGRSSVREAMSILEALGVVERRVGVGTHVLCRDEKMLDRALQAASDEGSVRDTYELQRILEVGIAELAARRMTPEHLAPIEAAWREMKKAAADESVDDYFKANRRFHLAIAEATENDLLLQEVSRLLHLMERPVWHAMKEYLMRRQSEYLSRSVRGLGRLLDAFRNRDTARACHLMEEHFSRIGRELLDEDDNT
ncbi:MAG: FCD domain-containing protein [Candidatus Bipolaricaulis sp.]|nr:FCD domain-containing protein [Candidatus Bipolaricaulis sp.]MDD5219768.1 FCD domain-containing protein [Candidatus Bipolaricaulis sp.]MDD5645958.1 FCD domain-containing protein [Candidatus Bipolaricaulis sp.]